eukprot:1189666-Pyramimonas_sp.AAC.1
MVLRPSLAWIPRESAEHQGSTETRGLSRVGPWEAILVRQCFDTFLGARCDWRGLTAGAADPDRRG